MPRKHDYAKVREVVGALDRQGIAVPEICRRLNENEAGLGYPVKISERSTYDYRKKFRSVNGPPRPEKVDRSQESLGALRDRMVGLIEREVRTLEATKAGTLSTQQSRALKEHFRTLQEMERRETSRQGPPRQRRTSKGEPDQSSQGSPQPLSTVERLAREAERQSG